MIVGKFPTNLKQHLKAYHQREYFKILEKEKNLRLLPNNGRHNKDDGVKCESRTSEKWMVCPASRNPKVERSRCITKRLSLFIISSHFGNNIVKDASFRALLHTLDNTYCIPDENAIAEQIYKLTNEMKSNILKCLSAAKKIHISIHTWAKKGMASFYLIVNAHFFSWFDHRCHHAILAAKSFHHNSVSTDYVQEVIEDVLENWNINQEKIGVLLTDNNSSILKSFSHSFINRRKRAMIDSLEQSRDKSDDIQLAATMYMQDDNWSDDTKLNEATNGDFSGIHLSCFADTLQLIILKFTNDQSIQQLLDQLYDLVKKVNQSCKAANELFSRIDKKVVENSPTRWISTYYLIKHLLEIKIPFNVLVQKLGWIPLPSQYWKVLEYIKGLLQPFAHHIATLINRKVNITISCIIPIIMELDLHLESMKQIAEIASVSSILQLELKRQFAKLTDYNCCNYVPIFAVSSLLDPRYKFVLNSDQVQIASEQILRNIDYKHSRSDASDLQVIESAGKEKADIDLSSKRFHHLSKIFQERLSQTAKRASSAKCELEKYLQDCHSVVENDDPFHFWITNADYLQLASIAVDILSVPASSVKMETNLIAMTELMNETHSQEDNAVQESRILLRENCQYFLH